MSIRTKRGGKLGGTSVVSERQSETKNYTITIRRSWSVAVTTINKQDEQSERKGAIMRVEGMLLRAAERREKFARPQFRALAQ
jgi:hypothetical protein